jgi:(p)ppGpp synthase/HD superfamily hydrolase
MSKNIILQAKEFAELRHANQFRPNKAKQPKTEHLAEVAVLVEKAGGSQSAVAAAWLHDVVEDTPTTLDEIKSLFGKEVSVLVDGLTDPKPFAALPLAERKKLQTERLKQKDEQVLLVKICDQISNVRSVLNDPPLVDWDNQKSCEYVEGAKLIAGVCKGQSQFLDRQFDEVYTQAVKKYYSAL